MFNHEYLTPSQLQGLENYKYKSIDSSPFSNYVMHPIWNTLIKVVPKWIAPNALTMLGFIFLLTKVVLLIIYDYEYYAAGERPNKDNLEGDEIPNSIYLISGILLLLYYNLDGLDGKQARRIGVVGPLGELFDHGLDSWAVFLIAFSAVSVIGRDEYSASIFRFFVTAIFCVVLNSYLAHCNQYMTGTLYLPWGYDVSMWVSSGLFLVAGIKGPRFFKVYFGSFTFFNIMEIAIIGFGVVTTLSGIAYNISQKKITTKINKFQAIRSLYSFAIIVIIMTFWALLTPNDVLERYPRVFLFLFGVLYSQITTRLILSCMCNTRCEAVCWLTWPVLVGLSLSLWQRTLEIMILHALVIFCTIAHVHYGICVVRQLCNHFNISCFKV